MYRVYLPIMGIVQSKGISMLLLQIQDMCTLNYTNETYFKLIQIIAASVIYINTYIIS